MEFAKPIIQKDQSSFDGDDQSSSDEDDLPVVTSTRVTTSKPISPLPKGIIEIESREHRLELIELSGTVVVKYSAEWCGPCKAIAPQYKKMANVHSNVVFAEEDVDEDFGGTPENVVAVPTFHIYQDNEFVESLKGGDLSKLESIIQIYKNK